MIINEISSQNPPPCVSTFVACWIQTKSCHKIFTPLLKIDKSPSSRDSYTLAWPIFAPLTRNIVICWGNVCFTTGARVPHEVPASSPPPPGTQIHLFWGFIFHDISDIILVRFLVEKGSPKYPPKSTFCGPKRCPKNCMFHDVKSSLNWSFSVICGP